MRAPQRRAPPRRLCDGTDVTSSAACSGALVHTPCLPAPTHSNVLASVGARSLVLVDELGKGTEVGRGWALPRAWAFA
jgi:hypothetical protein